MDLLFAATDVFGVFAAMAVAILAGFVKGATGFALPMIMISALATFLPGEMALAMLIIPTLMTNVIQAFGDGFGAALASARVFWRYLLIVLIAIAGSAQLVAVLPQTVFFLMLGVAILGFAAWQLSGRRMHIPPGMRYQVEVAVAGLAGLIGGISGVWGPPTVAYLTAIGATKDDSVRVQGVIYLAGAVMLVLAHLHSGVLNRETVPLSAVMVIPCGLGLFIGMRARGRMDDAKFRRWTLVVLAVAGANLVRRGIVGL